MPCIIVRQVGVEFFNKYCVNCAQQKKMLFLGRGLPYKQRDSSALVACSHLTVTEIIKLPIQLLRKTQLAQKAYLCEHESERF